MAGTLPQNAEALKDWLANFLAVLEPVITDFGMVAADLTVAKNFNTAYASSVDDYATQRAATSAAMVTRRDCCDGVTAVIRPIIDRVNNHPAMTNTLREQLGLRPRNLPQEAPLPISELKPLVRLEADQGAVMVHWGPNPGNESRNGKPDGVKSANIYRKKSGETDFQLVGNATRSPYYDSVTGPAADYTYVVRYRGARQVDLSLVSDEHTIAARGAMAA